MASHPWSEQDFIAGNPCLDFINTVGDTDKNRIRERLVDDQSLLTWARYSGMVGQGDRVQLSADALPRAISLREQLYSLFSGLARHTPTAGAWIQLRKELAEAVAHSELNTSDPASMRLEGADLCSRIALDALALLHSGQLHRLKECARCTWLFLDQSKAQRRRWCRTEACGNRARVERHYRKRSAREQD
ncbi:CGNR zinc finger domain-containing protein [Pseudomonas indica]|uniref:Conserved protein containing a Zn-ribbon-like motif, possibly RNA-binding n=1 Tax=Pseudomonas indica TaxID=137658 RepID=A0A1G9JEA4_9PSED|nr:ABATE domain-containing protein [Pseudomonas indica]SDL35632.1 Conserved protein containing a Zn-ribbon-like motif, possibly RNA-binding [Pseudomonas indica]